jgi:hypothetical protein
MENRFRARFYSTTCAVSGVLKSKQRWAGKASALSCCWELNKLYVTGEKEYLLGCIVYRMRTLLALAFISLVVLHAHAQLDTNLMREIKSWRRGDALPARLLKFPDGKIETSFKCGLQVLGSEVGDYIWTIEDADLLAALMFDLRTEADAFHDATSRLIKVKGVGHVSRVLAERRKAEPNAFIRSELAVLSQLLRSPYIEVQVARIAPQDLQPEKAEAALQAMRTDLESGMSWADAYRKHSDLHPDKRDRAKGTRNVRTLISYLYDSTVSPSGFDIITYRTAESLRAEHLREVFRLKRGTHIFKAADGVYLYHIRSYYADGESA